MPERNPFEETMRAGMVDVPQRTVRPNIGYDRMGPGRPPPGPPSNIGYDRMGGMPPGPPSNIGRDRMGGVMSLDGGQASNTYAALMGGMNRNRSQQGMGFGQTSGLSQTWQKILDQTGNEDLANQWLESQQAYNVGDTYPLEGGGGGYGTRGPFNMTPGNLPELQTIPLDMQFDQFGVPIGGDDFGYFDDEFASSGLGGTNERLMAELSLPQQEHMGGFYGNPTHYSTGSQGFEDYKLGVEGHEQKPWLGMFGGQEPATDQEIKDRLIQNIKNKKWGDDTPELRSYKDWGLV